MTSPDPEATKNYGQAIQSVTESFLDKGMNPMTCRAVMFSVCDALVDVRTATIITDILAAAGISPKNNSEEQAPSDS